jgi:hypothetical protein
MQPIALIATFSKASTLVDGGWRVSFDLSEQSGPEVSELAKLKGQALYIVIMDEEGRANGPDSN